MDFQKSDVLKIQAKADWKAKLASPGIMFVVIGSLLLSMVAISPVWNAVSLLHDFNYVFWAGQHTPQWTITVCLCIVFFYAATSGVFFRRAHASAQTEQTIMMIATVFITLFGLFLMIASMPLTRQAVMTSTNLLQNCDYSEQTHRLYEYSQVLQNIRAKPDCAKKFSVEECTGYQASPPYTDYLKSMENEFLCAGFCWKAPSTSAKGKAKSKLIDVSDRVRQHRNDRVTPLSLATESAESEDFIESDLRASASYPPTLFSDSNFQASCEGMAARDMNNFAGDIGAQTFFQGIYLVIIAVATGFLKLLGFCVRK